MNVGAVSRWRRLEGTRARGGAPFAPKSRLPSWESQVLGCYTVPMAFTYPYPRPAVTVDVAVFAPDSDRLRVLLIRRGRDPFAGRWALPGGFVDADEELMTAAARELVEETGLDARIGPQLGAYGTPGRDPRGHTVSVVFLAWLGTGPVELEGRDDATAAEWHDARRPPRLAFDHRSVLRDAVAEFELRASHGLPRYLELLPRTFEIGDAAALLRAAGAETGSTDPASRIRRECRRSKHVKELAPRAGRLTFRSN